jgi:hypothetical protein
MKNFDGIFFLLYGYSCKYGGIFRISNGYGAAAILFECCVSFALLRLDKPE